MKANNKIIWCDLIKELEKELSNIKEESSGIGQMPTYPKMAPPNPPYWTKTGEP